ncbi:hypothetical protein MKX01_015486 [Papaver californicum]|nr:hypothetical protein MKX01_015486 [Papaver californicum]
MKNPSRKQNSRRKERGRNIVVSIQEDLGSGRKEVLPAYKRRGRPQKRLKDEIDEENIKSTILIKEVKTLDAVENGRKRKKNLQVKEYMFLVHESLYHGGL